jgi:hypothetical protein
MSAKTITILILAALVAGLCFIAVRPANKDQSSVSAPKAGGAANSKPSNSIDLIRPPFLEK